MIDAFATVNRDVPFNVARTSRGRTLGQIKIIGEISNTRSSGEQHHDWNGHRAFHAAIVRGAAQQLVAVIPTI